MKKLIKSVSLAFLLFLGNCSKESDPIPTPNDLIVGNWTVSTSSVTIQVGTGSLVDYVNSLGMDLTPLEAQHIASEIIIYYELPRNYDIKKGGTYSSSTGFFNTLSTRTKTWELTADGKTLTLDKSGSYIMVFTVTRLSSTNLSLNGDLSNRDFGVTFTIHYEIALTK